MVEVKDLVKKYGQHVAVDHLSFTVERGNIYGFLGPNGAGKSTTMNIMTGYLGATEGKVLIDGHDIVEEPELAKRSIGYLPEIPPLYIDMTVLEYLKFAAALKKIPKEEQGEAIAQVVELTKLEDVQGRLIKNLSKGYKQRVGLAQAVLGFPEIIILDEPTVGLDPKQIIEIRELIRGLAQSHTVILSSHILAEVREVCNYIMIISNGKLVASDTPENLEKAYNASLEEVFLKLTEEVAAEPEDDVYENHECDDELGIVDDEEIEAEVSEEMVVEAQGETEIQDEVVEASEEDIQEEGGEEDDSDLQEGV